MGGSAPAMASQISEGYTLLTAVQLKRLTDAEMDLLLFELEKTLRDARGEQVDLEDIPALQVRNRKLRASRTPSCRSTWRSSAGGARCERGDVVATPRR
jgi:hypothetical protein